jgi:hypothetical protein
MVQEIREGSTGLVVTIDEDMMHAAAQRKRWHSITGGLQALAENRIGGRAVRIATNLRSCVSSLPASKANDRWPHAPNRSVLDRLLKTEHN